MINWWNWGAPPFVPPDPGDNKFWNARTGDSGLAGGDIDLHSWFLFFLIGAYHVCFSH